MDVVGANTGETQIGNLLALTIPDFRAPRLGRAIVLRIELPLASRPYGTADGTAGFMVHCHVYASDIQAILGRTLSPSRAELATTLAASDRLLPLTACVAPLSSAWIAGLGWGVLTRLLQSDGLRRRVTGECRNEGPKAR